MTPPTPGAGPAFPTGSHPGMSLREWYAGQALPGVIAARAYIGIGDPNAAVDHTQESIAEECFELADAMVAAGANVDPFTALANLAEAAREAQCACTVAERDSGHRVGCWMPELTAAIDQAEGVGD